MRTVNSLWCTDIVVLLKLKQSWLKLIWKCLLHIFVAQKGNIYEIIKIIQQTLFLEKIDTLSRKVIPVLAAFVKIWTKHLAASVNMTAANKCFIVKVVKLAYDENESGVVVWAGALSPCCCLCKELKNKGFNSEGNWSQIITKWHYLAVCECNIIWCFWGELGQHNLSPNYPYCNFHVYRLIARSHNICQSSVWLRFAQFLVTQPKTHGNKCAKVLF